MTDTYEANCYFLYTDEDDGNTYERCSEIHYTADTREDAVDAAWRFVQGRMKAIPDYFERIGCIKISTFNPLPIGNQGELRGATFMPFYEWKLDWIGRSMPEELARLEHLRKKRTKRNPIPAISADHGG